MTFQGRKANIIIIRTMKAILEFDLDDIDDRASHAMAIKSQSLVATLWTFDQHLRTSLKHRDLEGKVYDEIEAIREKLYEVMNDNNITFSEFNY